MQRFGEGMKRNMHWLIGIVESLSEVALTSISLYCLCYAIYSLNEFLKLTLPRNRPVTIVKNVESMCDQCKRKDVEVKRVFKACGHIFCKRCFLGKCIQLCECKDCRFVHFECHLCRHRKI